MAEYKKEISVAGAIAVAAALGLGLFAIAAFPNGQTASTQSVLSPAVLVGYLFPEGLTCSLATGACTMTLVNNSTVPLALESCQISPVVNTNSTPNPNPSLPNDTVTTWGVFNGTLGGPALAGIPAASSYAHGGEAAASCTIPMSDLSHAPKGSHVSGDFVVKLMSNWYNYPVGTLTSVGFGTAWS